MWCHSSRADSGRSLGSERPNSWASSSSGSNTDQSALSRSRVRAAARSPEVACRNAHNTSPGRRRAGTGSWAGLFNTHFFIDRTTGVCASIYSNSLPFVTPEAFGAYGDFEEALYAAL